MKTVKITLLTILMLMVAVEGVAQKKKRKDKNSKAEKTAVKLYEGPELPKEQVVVLFSKPEGKKHAYFIAANDENIPNKSLMSGAQQIMLLPGKHKIQMRFVSKGEIAIPVEAFEPCNFEAGKSYEVKFEHSSGKGDYLSAAKNTRIRIWIQEVGNPMVLTQKTVDGFGKQIVE